jgi:hypothetical protein
MPEGFHNRLVFKDGGIGCLNEGEDKRKKTAELKRPRYIEIASFAYNPTPCALSPNPFHDSSAPTFQLLHSMIWHHGNADRV